VQLDELELEQKVFHLLGSATYPAEQAWALHRALLSQHAVFFSAAVAPDANVIVSGFAFAVCSFAVHEELFAQ